VLPKQAWLEQRGVDGQWPCWGFPRHIHLDNAKEFHGEMLRRACEQYGIHLEYRPVAQPHMGGHIERLLGTLMRALHELPGATFSNPRQRGKYDSDATATMTLRELEHWFTEYVVSVYHIKLHRGIGMTPLGRWSAALPADSGGRNSSDILSLPSAQERIRLDFLPFVERMIQPIGVVIDGIQYFHDVFRSLVGSIDGGRRRKFLFRRDPRDISTIFFWNPDMQQYTSIPYRNTSHPAISAWELRELRRKLQKSGNAQITEQAIFMAYERLREREACATHTTKRIRRERERRPQARHSSTVHEVIAPEPSATVIMLGEITPFEIEESS
jgi:putative transposase